MGSGNATVNIDNSSTLTTGTIYNGTQEATSALSALSDLYDDVTNFDGEIVVMDSPELGGTTLTKGVYKSVQSGFTISQDSTLTLDAEGDPNAGFVFIGTQHVIAGDIELVNNAQAGNVLWISTDDMSLVWVKNGAHGFRGSIIASGNVDVSGDTTNTVPLDLQGHIASLNGTVDVNYTVADRSQLPTTFPDITLTAEPGEPAPGEPGGDEDTPGLPETGVGPVIPGWLPIVLLVIITVVWGAIKFNNVKKQNQ